MSSALSSEVHTAPQFFDLAASGPCAPIAAAYSYATEYFDFASTAPLGAEDEALVAETVVAFRSDLPKLRAITLSPLTVVPVIESSTGTATALTCGLKATVQRIGPIAVRQSDASESIRPVIAFKISVRWKPTRAMNLSTQGMYLRLVYTYGHIELMPRMKISGVCAV